MTEKEFADLLDFSCSKEELLQCKDKLNIEFYYKEDIDVLFAMVQKEKVSFLDRATFMRILIDYICTTGNSISFIMNLFVELLRKDGCSKEAIEYAKSIAYRQASNARDIKEHREILKIKQIRRDERRREEEKIRKEKALQELEKTLDMSKTCVNYDTARFLLRNGTSYEKMASQINLSIMKLKDIDPMLDFYRINYAYEQEKISVGDIVGYEYFPRQSTDLLKEFSNFFDSNVRDGYRQRSLSMLNLTCENALEELSSSFSEEPIVVCDTLDGRYVVHTNGRHRYSVLRSLYLIEMLRANGDEEKEKMVYEKYKIPVMVMKVDLIKTYTNYIFNFLKAPFWLRTEVDNNCCYTGRTQIVYSEERREILTNEELLELAKQWLLDHKERTKELFQYPNEKFLYFVKSLVPELAEEIEIDWEEENARAV